MERRQIAGRRWGRAGLKVLDLVNYGSADASFVPRSASLPRPSQPEASSQTLVRLVRATAPSPARSPVMNTNPLKRVELLIYREIYTSY